MVYGSYTDPNPSAAYYDFSYLLTAAEGEVMASSCSTTHVTMDDVAGTTEECDQCGSSQEKKRQTEEEEEITVYITIEGVSDMENTFSLNSSVGSAFGEWFALLFNYSSAFLCKSVVMIISAVKMKCFFRI